MIWSMCHVEWKGRQEFECYGPGSLKNGLTLDENRVLARTPHIDQVVTLVMLGLNRLGTGTKGNSTIPRG